MKEINNRTFYDIFDGLLLSDGYIRHPKRAKNCRYSHTCKHKEYILYLMSCLDKAGFGFSENAPYEFVHKKMNDAVTYTFESHMDEFFLEQRARWYPQGIKIVPRDIELTPSVLLHWFIGDGELNHSKKVYTTGIRFNTHSFIRDNLEFLQQKMTELDFPVSIHSRGRLYLGSEFFKNFLFYIGTSPVSCYEYKWIVNSREQYDERLLNG